MATKSNHQTKIILLLAILLIVLGIVSYVYQIKFSLYTSSAAGKPQQRSEEFPLVPANSRCNSILGDPAGNLRRRCLEQEEKKREDELAKQKDESCKNRSTSANGTVTTCGLSFVNGVERCICYENSSKNLKCSLENARQVCSWRDYCNKGKQWACDAKAKAEKEGCLSVSCGLH